MFTAGERDEYRIERERERPFAKRKKQPADLAHPQTFDDAFQSRIHIALRYDALDQKAKRTIFKIFVERVRVLEKADPTPLTEEDYADLAKHDLNGRQIKNTVRTAQALAVNKGEALGMRHIRQVLDVLVSFDRDLKGGTGYQEAMRSYF